MYFFRGATQFDLSIHSDRTNIRRTLITGVHSRPSILACALGKAQEKPIRRSGHTALALSAARFDGARYRVLTLFLSVYGVCLIEGILPQKFVLVKHKFYVFCVMI